jgi:hypothetical protein
MMMIIMAYYKKLLRRMLPAPNMSMFLQTTLAADALLAEGHFLHEERTLNNAKSLIYQAECPET